MNKTITLANGNGGEENNELITKVFYKAFKNEILERSEDAAVLNTNGQIAMSTDSFTVSPLFFSGADIGKLSVCGTCNDLAMMGAKPKYLTIGVILEEGFIKRDLEKIVKSIKKELEINNAIIVSGDTKVMPKGTIDKIIINTTGIGEIQKEGISSNNITSEDIILVSRDIGCHGATIFAAREGIELSNNIQSDCTSLYPIVQKLIDEDINITALRDATRGGVSAVLNEWAKQSNICIEIDEDKIPINQEVNGMCEMLGFEAMSLANEGTFCLAIKKQDAKKTLEILQGFNQNATILGKVTDKYIQKVILNSAYGTQRFLDMPTGELLPRIC
ncbi:[NiFe] hydrogenase metallocenter assembly protein HypE [hydrothermal vent metagenome]|uniref:[NiFe] hydrogenase metallocenter assembly protein HypE n=1 Tax=hydrothermal vent metagenome TaxID=652676 RepID=A0A3B1DXY6_9ZZZZ